MAMRSGKDKEFPKLTIKHANFLRAYKTRTEEKGKPPSCKEMADIAGSREYAAAVTHTLRVKGYLPSIPSAQDGEHSDLTKQRADVLRKWNAFKEGSGRDPTLKEMSYLLGKSITVIGKHLYHLREAGHLPPSKAQVPDAEFPDIGERTANILRAFKRATTKCGGAPTIREIIAETDLSWRSTNTVVEAVNRLVIAGYLIRGPENKSRGIRLTEKAFPTEKAWERAVEDKDFRTRFLGESDDDFRKRIASDTQPTGLGPPNGTELTAKVGEAHLAVNTHTGLVVLNHEDGTRAVMRLPGDPIHRKAAFADLLWILQGAAAK